MSENKHFQFGPLALTTTLTTNILNPADAGAGQVGYTPTASVITLKRIRILNKTDAEAGFSLWIGATGANAAGTEFLGSDMVVPAREALEFYMERQLLSTDFLVGGADTAAALTIEGDGEIGLA